MPSLLQYDGKRPSYRLAVVMPIVDSNISRRTLSPLSDTCVMVLVASVIRLKIPRLQFSDFPASVLFALLHLSPNCTHTTLHTHNHTQSHSHTHTHTLWIPYSGQTTSDLSVSPNVLDTSVWQQFASLLKNALLSHASLQ
jgi:hypothetical protein